VRPWRRCTCRVSTRKVAADYRGVCGHEFQRQQHQRDHGPAGSQLDEFSHATEQEFPYLILDARYERVRRGG